MSRADQLLPEGWKPKVGSVVHIEPTKDDPAPPAGLWRAFSNAPEPGTWWLLPQDEAARSWAGEHRDKLTTGCVARHGRTLVPRGFRRARASDLSPDALRRMAG